MLDTPICYSVQLGVLTRENSKDVLKTVLVGGGTFVFVIILVWLR